jgi:hypothetical protein
LPRIAAIMSSGACIIDDEPRESNISSKLISVNSVLPSPPGNIAAIANVVPAAKCPQARRDRRSRFRPTFGQGTIRTAIPRTPDSCSAVFCSAGLRIKPAACRKLSMSDYEHVRLVG